MDRTTSLFEVFLYGLAISAIGTLGSFFWAEPLMRRLEAFLPSSLEALWNNTTSATTLLYAPLAGVCAIGCNTIFIFLSLRLFARRKTSFSLVFRMVSYAQAAMLFAIIPVVGPILALLWSFWLYLNGMHAIAGISRFKSFMIMVLPPLILAGIILVFIVLAVVGIGIFSIELLKDSLAPYR